MELNTQKIVLITSGQPSLNPRLVKEADALVDRGYEVTVIYQYWNEWATELDKELLPLKKWKTIRVGGDPFKEKTTYWWSRLKLKIGQKLIHLLGFNYNLAELSIGRCTFELLNEAKRNEAALYIAHNLAALPAAIAAAQKFNVKCGFDAEDLHRYETSSNDLDLQVRVKAYIEEKYFKQTDYLTTSSFGIAQKYQQLFPSLKFKVILNVFPKANIKDRTHSNQILKLFWFSQSIGLSRGIQDIFGALKTIQDFNIEFHLLGDLNDSVKQVLENNIKSLHFSSPPKIIYHAPISSDELFEFAAQFDIGLATEPSFSINNDLALSNKIFTYIQSGLAVITSATTAQKAFMLQYPNMGQVYQSKNTADLANAITKYLVEPDLLKTHQNQAKLNAQKILNWEIEKEKFLTIISDT